MKQKTIEQQFRKIDEKDHILLRPDRHIGNVGIQELDYYLYRNNKFELIENFKFNDALLAIWELISFCDKYINDEKLWETKKPEVINDLFFAIKEIGILLEPFLPATAEKIKTAVAAKSSPNLFPKILVAK